MSSALWLMPIVANNTAGGYEVFDPCSWWGGPEYYYYDGDGGGVYCETYIPSFPFKNGEPAPIGAKPEQYLDVSKPSGAN